jgi:hypothetical protein
MSTSLTTPKALSTQERTRVAIQRLRELINADDMKLLNAAIAEAAAAEAARNADFRATLRRVYEDLRAHASSAARSQRSREQPAVALIPLPGSEGARFDPFAPLDPYALLRLYGSQQLQAALSNYSIVALRQAAAVVRQKRPGTKPADARKADSIIAYIVQNLTEDVPH